MQATGFGDLAASLGRQQQIAQIKRTIDARSTEMITGVAADTAAAVRGQMGPLAAIDSSLSRLAAWDANIDNTGRQIASMQLAFESLETFSNTARHGLMSAAATGNESQIRVAMVDAREKLAGVIGLLNTRVGERSVFSGMASGQSPFQGTADDIIEAAAGVFEDAADTDAAIAALDAWFDDPDGFSAQFYRGSDRPIGPVSVGEGHSITLGVTADHAAIRKTLKAFTLAALADRGPSGANAMVEVTDTAARMMLTSASDRALVSSTLGLADGQIETARSRNAAERTALQVARNAIVTVDPFAAATALTEAQQQLETLFATTARLSRLSLVNYL